MKGTRMNIQIPTISQKSDNDVFKKKIRYISLIGAPILPLVLLFLLFGAVRETTDLNDAIRAGMANESFITLKDGVTHYEWQGPENGPKVVLVHGYSSPYFIWDRTIPALAKAGFRVLRFDLYGRGLSERLQGEYSPDVYDRQLLNLLDSLNVSEPVDLVGLSMGGAIVTLFTDRHPERVRKLVLIGPAGVNNLPRITRLLRAPLVGDWFTKAFGNIIVTQIMPREIAIDPSGVADAKAAYANQLKYRGYKHALLSTLRSGPLAGLEDSFTRVGRQNRKGLLLWGSDDTIVPYNIHERVKEFIPWLDFKPIEGGRHCVNYEKPEKVNPLLIAFLSA
jgi:pimeloyl-ACP methyl ester carboxylesterase